MEQKLMKIISDLMPKIKNRTAKFDEAELVPIKAFWEEITGYKIGNMMNCGGHLCEDVRRSIVNYMATHQHVNPNKPKKTTVKDKEVAKADEKKPAKVEKKTEEPKAEEAKVEEKKEETPAEDTDDRSGFMAECLKLTEEKGIKKPHHRSGIETLKEYLEENK